MGRLTCALLISLALLGACDMKRISELEEGVSTEADVRSKFGEPAAVYPGDAGARVFEYPRQPEGQVNYMITIGADGKMSALRQVLKAENFAKVQPGMNKAELRQLLGRPAQTKVYEQKNEEVWDWRFRQEPEDKVFSVTLDMSGAVKTTAVDLDSRSKYTGGN